MSLRSLSVAVGAAAIGLSACAPLARPAFIEIEMSGIPENPVAVTMGTFKTIVQDRMRGQSEFAFDLAKQRFTGMMQTVDGSVTTSGAGSTNTRAAAVGATGGGRVGAVAAQSQQRTASTATTVQGSSNGVANAVSDKGMTMSCDYVINNRQFTGSGDCSFSNGAKYRVFANPIRVVMSDGSSRPMQ